MVVMLSFVIARSVSDEAIQCRSGVDCFASLAMTFSTSIQLLDRHRDALADTDAHRRKRPLSAALLHSMHRGDHQPRAAHAERVTESNGAAMRVDEIGVVLDAELPQTRYALACERFIELDQIEIGDFEPEAFHQFPCRRDRPDSHDP